MMAENGRLPNGRYHAVVVGAGPAGSTAAIELARHGLEVLLVDRAVFPRSKVCGCCLNPRALGVLAQLGLADLPEIRGAPRIESLALATRGRLAVLRHRLGVSLSREVFDFALARAARDAGAQVVFGTTAQLLSTEVGNGLRLVRLRRGPDVEEVRTRVVVDAAGLSGTLHEPGTARDRSIAANSKLGAGAIAPGLPHGYQAHRIYMACGRDGYVGLVCLEDGRLDLAAAMQPEAVQRAGGLGVLAGQILNEAGLPPVPEIATLPWKGTPLLTSEAHAIAGRSIFRVGDAAGYVEPFTGEGIAWALAGSMELAKILANLRAGSESMCAQMWIAAYRRLVQDRQTACRVTAVILRDVGLTGWLVRILRVAPGLARPVLWQMHRASGPNSWSRFSFRGHCLQ